MDGGNTSTPANTTTRFVYIDGGWQQQQKNFIPNRSDNNAINTTSVRLPLTCKLQTKFCQATYTRRKNIVTQRETTNGLKIQRQFNRLSTVCHASGDFSSFSNGQKHCPTIYRSFMLKEASNFFFTCLSNMTDKKYIEANITKRSTQNKQILSALISIFSVC